MEQLTFHMTNKYALRFTGSSRTTIFTRQRLIGLVQLPDTKALTLFNVIKDFLLRYSLPIASCISQAYDGASNVSWVRNSVQALMKKEANSYLYVHCLPIS
jgi:hypothetical protein